MTHTARNPKIYEGHIVKRFRETPVIKQNVLDFALDEDWNQQKISLLEQKETIDIGLLQQIAIALKIPVETIKNFDEEAAINVISNTFNNHDHSSSQFASVIHNAPTFNPIDKIVELYDEKIALYERTLKEKDEIMMRLEKLIEAK